MDMELGGWLHPKLANSSVSKWKPLMSIFSQGSLVGPLLFSNFINDMDCGIECTLSKSVNNTKLCGVVDTVQGRDDIHWDLDKLEQWAHVNLIKFNKVLHLNQGNPQYLYRLGDELIESCPADKHLGTVVVDEKLDRI